MYQKISIIPLCAFIAILITLLFMDSCKKDAVMPTASSTLCIEEAKQFFSSIMPEETILMRSDSAELGPIGPTIVPDWNNAVSYFDEVKQQSVVEAPILKGSFSRYLINPGNMMVDTTFFLNGPTNNRLIIVRDIKGVTDYAIMKIAGTYQNDPNLELLNANTYRQMDSHFEGIVNYVNIYDQVRQSFYRYSGHFYEIDSIKQDGAHQNEAQDRWEIICVRVYEFIPCSCAPHHGVGEEGCSCVAHGGSAPSVISYMECFESGTFVNSQPGGSGTNPPPINVHNGGGSASNPNQNNWNCFMQNVNTFDSIYGTDLLTDYEDIAHECSDGCSGSYDDYEICVKNGIHKNLVVEAPNTPIPDLAARLACFNIQNNNNLTHKITVYVDQPVRKSDMAWNIKGSVGHTFISLEQKDVSGNTTILTVGFYPGAAVAPCAPKSSGVFGDDKGHSYDQSVTWNISPSDFNKVINNIILGGTPQYDLSSYNCCTWAGLAISGIGRQIPIKPVLSYVDPAIPNCRIFGIAPGQLGEDIRSNSYHPNLNGVKNLIGGNAPDSNCQ